MISTQELILAQEKSISDLLQAVKEQSEHLKNQKIKIKSLENKVVVFISPLRCVNLLHKHTPKLLIVKTQRRCHFTSS